MQVVINFDEQQYRNTLAEIRQHFPGLPPEAEEQLRRAVELVGQTYRIPTDRAVKMVVGHLLATSPELVRQSVELAEERLPATSWRELRRKVSRSVARTFGKLPGKRAALEALAKSVERKEL